MTDRAKWLAGLKVGDKAIASHWITTVCRFTRTQIVTVQGRFRKLDGRSVSHGQYGDKGHCWLEPWWLSDNVLLAGKVGR